MGVYVVIKFPLGLKLLKPVDLVFCCLMFITSNNLNLKSRVIEKIVVKYSTPRINLTNQYYTSLHKPAK